VAEVTMFFPIKKISPSKDVCIVPNCMQLSRVLPCWLRNLLGFSLLVPYKQSTIFYKWVQQNVFSRKLDKSVICWMHVNLDYSPRVTGYQHGTWTWPQFHLSCTSHFDSVHFFSGVNIVQPLIDLIHLDLSVRLSTSELLIYDYLCLWWFLIWLHAAIRIHFIISH
jgi:hypothetical protein